MYNTNSHPWDGGGGGKATGKKPKIDGALLRKEEEKNPKINGTTPLFQTSILYLVSIIQCCGIIYRSPGSNL